jgi:hypothetical protein
MMLRPFLWMLQALTALDMRSLRHLRSSMKHQDISHLYMPFEWAAYQCASHQIIAESSQCSWNRNSCTLVNSLIFDPYSMGMKYEG